MEGISGVVAFHLISFVSNEYLWGYKLCKFEKAKQSLIYAF
jgi:hypothetical protein